MFLKIWASPSAPMNTNDTGMWEQMIKTIFAILFVVSILYLLPTNNKLTNTEFNQSDCGKCKSNFTTTIIFEVWLREENKKIK